MRTNTLFHRIWLAMGALAFVFIVGCEGPMGPAGPTGPAGPAGPTGPAGADGTDGTDGVSGSAECLECHSSDAKYTVTQQYEQSGHAVGSTAARGSTALCSRCHSKEGFVEVMWSGDLVPAGGFNYPSRIGCTTCHAWHNESFDTAEDPDYALRANGPVSFYMYASNSNITDVEFDQGGNGNLCANCHQPMEAWQTVLEDESGGNIDQTSTHFGPHHGPQSSTMAMEGAYVETVPSTASFHARMLSCTDCHMYEQDHTFEPQLAACNTASCHDGGITSLDANTRQVAVNSDLADLETALVTAGLLVSDGEGGFDIVTGVFPTAQVGALFNYEWIMDDKSAGIHNFAYVEQMLTDALAAF